MVASSWGSSDAMNNGRGGGVLTRCEHMYLECKEYLDDMKGKPMNKHPNTPSSDNFRKHSICSCSVKSLRDVHSRDFCAETLGHVRFFLLCLLITSSSSQGPLLPEMTSQLGHISILSQTLLSGEPD